MSVLAGVDLGGTKIKALITTPEGVELDRVATSTDDTPGEHPPVFARKIKSLLQAAEQRLGAIIGQVGISAPGLAARDRRSIAHMPGRMQGLEGWDWPDWLERETVVLNDAQAALLGEVWQGAARGEREVVMLTLGTGVGGAILCQGQLLRGHHGKAGHVGHLCLDPFGAPTIAGMPGGLENWIGNHNIEERTGGRFGSTLDLIVATQAGDPEARAVWQRSVRALGCAIASLANIFDPAVVVVGGGIASAGESFFQSLQAVLDEVEWRPTGERVRVVPAEMGEWAGAYGAAWAAHYDPV